MASNQGVGDRRNNLFHIFLY